MGLDDLYRNTKVMDVFAGSPIRNAVSKRCATMDTATLGINESLLAIVIRGSSWAGYAPAGQPGSVGTLTVRFFQNPGTNASSWTAIAGSTMVRTTKNTIIATPINATQRYIAGSYRVQRGGGTHIQFSIALVGSGRVLPLSVSK